MYYLLVLQGSSNVVYNGSFFYYNEEKEAIGKLNDTSR
jgi:hypothetical protein